MKKTTKILAIMLIAILVMATSTVSFATTDDKADDKADDKTQTKVEEVLETIGKGNSNVETTGLTDLGSSIFSVIQVVGISIAVIILLVLGIKYMMGSAEEKADYKKSMIPYIVGAILLFAGSTIVGLVYQLANSLNQ